ncbi:MAG: hypothetical protein WC838_03185 [Candidatus Margulisiibacteriota bacterium]|jgi:hypothetical protein
MMDRKIISGTQVNKDISNEYKNWDAIRDARPNELAKVVARLKAQLKPAQLTYALRLWKEEPAVVLDVFGQIDHPTEEQIALATNTVAVSDIPKVCARLKNIHRRLSNTIARVALSIAFPPDISTIFERIHQPSETMALKALLRVREFPKLAREVYAMISETGRTAKVRALMKEIGN